MPAKAGEAAPGAGAATAEDAPERRAPLVHIGRILGPHGVRGEVRLQSFAARAEDIAAYGPLRDAHGQKHVVIEHVQGTARRLRRRIRGVASRGEAEALRGLDLYVGRDRLPALAAEEYYAADLIGLAAERSDGRPLGRVLAVENYGAGDVLEIGPAPGRSVLVPFTRATVPEVVPAAGRVVIDLPASLEQDVQAWDPAHRPT